MELRNLHRRARPFRYLSFWAMAAVCLLLVGGPRPLPVLLAGAAFCIAWPPLVDAWFRRRSPSAGADTGRALRVHLLECVLCGLLFGWLSLPPAGALAAAVALLAGVTAQAGWQLLCAAIPFVGIGLSAGMLAAPVLTLASAPLADTAAALLALGFVVALAQASFRQAQRLHARERSAQGRARRLESMTVRMEPYLAPTLRARIQAAAVDGVDPVFDGSGSQRDRRWLTVAFVDLVGFTSLAVRIDAETLANLLDEYLVSVCELALRQGGEVTKVLGDGVLVAFGLDGGSDRRATAGGAVRFCQAVPALIGELRRRWRTRGEPVDLRMRAGIASGYCTVGDWGGAGYRDFTMIGSVVNLASRLQVSAEPDGVLLDLATAALVESDVALEPLRELDVPGLGRVAARSLAAGTAAGTAAEAGARGGPCG